MQPFRGVAVLAVLCGSLTFGLDTSKLKPTGYVNDFAHVIDARSASQIENYCGMVERLTGTQMAVVLIPSLDGQDLENTATDLYKQWGIGKKGKDEGLLILMATNDH